MDLKLCNKCKYAHQVWANGGWSFIGCYGGDYNGKWVAEIVDCPIFGEALQKKHREGDEPMQAGDLISRKDALDALRMAQKTSDILYVPQRTRQALKNIPAVDAAPVVHGNWIECYERSRHYYCSNCGKVQGIASIVMKYCPECGAKMAQHPWAGRYADQSGAEYADNPTV